ncbi:unnamed protein product [Allacma fusca]|uniref:MICAL-like protein 1 n=1 Tax=Allacma fusca TaxID=39272 RepID=A0A8J2PE32_9HEXA|nr:unnamed protein product [Allacma fusca]
MTTSWKNGLAFCAIIHRFRPDLINYEGLNENDIIRNCTLAFETAESKLGIPALLDPEDMLAMKVPDRLSMLTYVAQYYHYFKQSNNSGSSTHKILPKRDHLGSSTHKILLKSDHLGSSTHKILPKRDHLGSINHNQLPMDGPKSSESPEDNPRILHQTNQNSSSPMKDEVIKSKFRQPKIDTIDSQLENNANESKANSYRLKFRMSQEKKGMAALEEWARKVTSGYRGVSIRNMTTSWRNGLAFCAIIHRFHPELIDYDSLDENDIVGNCTLAFDTAESKLGIPALLDPDDMLAIEVPDRLSILTYVAQYYNCFRHSKNKSTVSSERVSHDENHPNGILPQKVGSKREMSSDDILEATRDRAPKRPVLLSSQNVCTVCGNPVFILERVLFDKKLYHSSCFRCSNCDSTLNPNTADISPDGKLFCLDNDCHRKLQQLNRKNTPVSKMLERQTVTTNVSHNETPAVPTLVSSTTQPSIPRTNVWDIGKSEDVKEFKPSRIRIPPAFLTGYTPSPTVAPTVKTESHPKTATFPSIEIQNVRAASEAVAEESVVDSGGANKVENAEQLPDDRLNIEVVQNPTATEGDKNRSVSFSAIVEVAKIESSSSSESQVADVEEVGSRVDEVEKSEEITLECSNNVQKVESNDSQGSDIIGDRLSIDQEDEVISNVREAESVDVHDVGKPVETSKEIPEVQNIQEVDELNNITDEARKPEKEHITGTDTGNPFEEEENSIEVDEPKSPKPKPQNAFEYLKNNLEIIETVVNQQEPDKSTETDGKDFDNTQPILIVEDIEEDKQETVSHNESGVGDSLQSDTKSDTDSVNLSASDSRDKEAKFDEFEVTEITNDADNISSSSVILPGGEGEVSKPPVTPRSRRSKSPSVPIDNNSLPTPTPTPRKKTSSTSEMWKNKDYYPAELNPFESEDTFTLKPSDILIIKTSSSHERLPPLNPFEEDEDDPQKERSPPPQPPKSPAFSVRSNESFNTGSVSVRSRKSRRAPLPPSMLQTVSPTKEKRPAPPPPRPISSDHLISPKTVGGTPEKKLIPASPDLLKGLKNQTNKATAQHYRKKRRAPPPKRHVTALPEAAIKTELADLAVKEKEFERQGITLEANIRRLMAQEDENLEEQIEEMVIQLWNIVNEKNDILRRQTELDYLRRGHRLEEMQAEVEFQLRMLMDTPPDQRQEGQEDAEQQLLQDLLKIVDERNEVVDWLDFHRQLDREEDMHVSQSLTSFSSVSRSSTPTPTHVVLPIKSEVVIEEQKETISVPKNIKNKEKSKEEGKKKEKFKAFSFFSKKKKNSKSKKRDEDKDNDESLKVTS